MATWSSSGLQKALLPLRPWQVGSMPDVICIIASCTLMIQLIRNVYFMYSYIIANKMIEVSKVTKAYHKIRTMKRPKMKNFNIVKKLNKVTKQKKLKKHFSKNFKGKVIDGVHELFVLTAGIMLGIKCSVSDDTIRWEGWMDGCGTR
jgi:hypothetical protein